MMVRRYQHPSKQHMKCERMAPSMQAKGRHCGSVIQVSIWVAIMFRHSDKQNQDSPVIYAELQSPLTSTGYHRLSQVAVSLSLVLHRDSEFKVMPIKTRMHDKDAYILNNQFRPTKRQTCTTYTILRPDVYMHRASSNDEGP